MKLLRCNRCKAEVELPNTSEVTGNSAVRVVNHMNNLTKMRGWSHVTIQTLGALVAPPARVLDICQDCLEVLLEQFMKGAEVAPITTPLEQTVIPHQPMVDCQLIWNPGTGRFLCRHDDPELFDALVVDQDEQATSETDDAMAEVRAKIDQTVEDMATAAVAHAVPQRCGAECSEAHTYERDCLLAGVVKVPNQRQNKEQGE